jgi:hypothetical protein
VTRARFWIVSLDPAVRDSDVPCVVPSVSVKLVPVVSEAPSVCDREVPRDAPADLLWPRENDVLVPSECCCSVWFSSRKNSHGPCLNVLPLFLLQPLVTELLTEVFVPSDSDVPLEDDTPRLCDCDRAVLCEVLSDSDVLSLSDRTSRITSVSPISLDT